MQTLPCSPGRLLAIPTTISLYRSAGRPFFPAHLWWQQSGSEHVHTQCGRVCVNVTCAYSTLAQYPGRAPATSAQGPSCSIICTLDAATSVKKGSGQRHYGPSVAWTVMPWLKRSIPNHDWACVPWRQTARFISQLGHLACCVILGKSFDLCVLWFFHE